MTNRELEDLEFYSRPETKRPLVRNKIDLKTARFYFMYDKGQLVWRRDMGRNRRLGDRAGTLKNTGYRSVQLYGEAYQEHRLVYLLCHGNLPDMIDHINGDKQDNRVENLRETTASLNQANRRQVKKRGRYKGARYDGYKFVAAIQHNGKSQILGRFSKEEDAARAYDAKAVELFGSHAKTNF